MLKRMHSLYDKISDKAKIGAAIDRAAGDKTKAKAKVLKVKKVKVGVKKLKK